MAPKPKPKPSPSQATAPQQPQVAIEDLFTNLNKLIERSDYAQSVKIADQILSVSPNDEDAIRCKVVAFVKDDKIEEALSAMESYRRLAP